VVDAPKVSDFLTINYNIFNIFNIQNAIALHLSADKDANVIKNVIVPAKQEERRRIAAKNEARINNFATHL
jgi:hypothetical protein